MKNSIFLIAIAGLLFVFEVLAAPSIPYGFTDDRSKSLELVVSIPIETQSAINSESVVFSHSLRKILCKNLKINISRSITTTIEKEQYTLISYSGLTHRYNNGQYKVVCIFGWIKTKHMHHDWGDKYIDKRFGPYYMIKAPY